MLRCARYDRRPNFIILIRVMRRAAFAVHKRPVCRLPRCTPTRGNAKIRTPTEHSAPEGESIPQSRRNPPNSQGQVDCAYLALLQVMVLMCRSRRYTQ
jgi:hypothetical protein